MNMVAKLLTALAGIAFVLGCASAVIGRALFLTPQGYSRVTTDLALLAVAVTLSFGSGSLTGKSTT